jgi:hypothetical protein
MTIQDLGSLGEFITALATLATLVYVAVQIRQNTRSGRASSFQASSNDIFNIIDQLALDPELNRIYFAGTRDYASLSPEDRRRFGSYMSSLIGRWENLVFQGEQGMLDPMSLTFFFQNMRVSYAQPGTQQWWRKVRHLYPQKVQLLVERDFIGERGAPMPSHTLKFTGEGEQ